MISIARLMGVGFMLAGLLALSGCGYNDLQGLDEDTKAAWSEVINQYQRRADLIPNLVNTVKGYATHEKETLESVVQARAKATSVQITPELLKDEAAFRKFQEAQQGLSSALGRLLALAENYPDLKANQNFIELQKAMGTIEDDLQNSRRYYNATVRDYNTQCDTFPSVLIANMFQFVKKPFFELESAEEAKNIKISF